MRLHSHVLADMLAAEAGQQRYVRALLLNPADTEARARLLEIETTIQALRVEYAGVSAQGADQGAQIAP